MTSMGDYAAGVMWHMVTHPAHGYTQGNRWGNGEMETITVLDRYFQIALGDRDCSSGGISAWQAVGVDCGGATYTGNMRQCMTGTGNFAWYPGTDFIASPGDLYLNEQNHVAMCLQQVPDQLMEFSMSETGGIFGQEGDQTGNESHVAPYYNFPWDGILHYVGGGECNTSTPPAAPEPNVPLPYLAYKASLDPSGLSWLPEMQDWRDTGGSADDFAGDGLSPIRWLAIDMPGWYQVQTVDGGWLDPVRGYDTADLVYGCAGDGSPILAVRAYYETQNPAETGWREIAYQVADPYETWLPEMHDLTSSDGDPDDFAGDGDRTPIAKFRARLIAG